MMLYKTLLSMALIGMAVQVGAEEDIILHEEDGNDNTTQTIVGGQQLSQRDRARRPFLVNVGFIDPIDGHDLFQCGGSLITPRSILTAAHCVLDTALNPDEPNWIDFFRYDKTDAIGTGGSVRVTLTPGSCVPHWGYLAGGTQDVALCFLPAPAPAGATPITLNSDPTVPAPGAPLDVAGWGVRLEEDHNVPEPPPRWQERTTVPFVTTLNHVFPCAAHPTPSDMCLVAPDSATCHGDSGKNTFLP
jgi:secreted trypsin-like serine protease